MEIQVAIGLIAGTLTTASFVPQLIKTYKLKKANEIAFTMYIVIIAGMIMWITYGLMIASVPIIAANFIAMLICVTILVLKYKYDGFQTKSVNPMGTK